MRKAVRAWIHANPKSGLVSRSWLRPFSGRALQAGRLRYGMKSYTLSSA